MAARDFEKLGAFYVGRAVDEASGDTTEAPVLNSGFQRHTSPGHSSSTSGRCAPSSSSVMRTSMP